MPTGTCLSILFNPGWHRHERNLATSHYAGSGRLSSAADFLARKCSLLEVWTLPWALRIALSALCCCLEWPRPAPLSRTCRWATLPGGVSAQFSAYSSLCFPVVLSCGALLRETLCLSCCAVAGLAFLHVQALSPAAVLLTPAALCQWLLVLLGCWVVKDNFWSQRSASFCAERRVRHRCTSSSCVNVVA